MNIPFQFGAPEYERLQKAHTLHKYSHLESWKELFLYQVNIAHGRQLLEIASYAKRKNKGEKITLPLKDYKNL